MGERLFIAARRNLVSGKEYFPGQDTFYFIAGIQLINQITLIFGQFLLI